MSNPQRPRPEVLAFLDAIKENPDDDTPRLILADWLEEHGDPRGTFLRLECELARMERTDPRRQPLARHARELLAEQREEWLGPIGQSFQAGNTDRGLWSLGLNADVFASLNCPSVWESEAWAWVEQVSFSHFGREEELPVDTIACSPLLRSLVELHLSCKSGLGSLLQSSQLPRLQRLDLSHSGVGIDNARALAQTSLLTPLTHLNLRGTALTDAELQELAGSPCWGKLRSLKLSGNHVGVDGVTRLGNSLAVDHLEVLELGGCRLQPDAVKGLCSPGRLTQVQELGLELNAISDAGLQAVADCPMRELRVLQLRGNQIGDVGITALAHSPNIRQLTTLGLWHNQIGDAGLGALAASENFTCLTHLDLTENQIGDAGIVALAASPNLSQLIELDLRRNRIGDVGGRALGRSPHLNRMQGLSLYGSDFSLEVRLLLRARFDRCVYF